MRQQQSDVMAQRGEQPREHATHPGVRIVAIGLGGSNQDHDRSRAPALSVWQRASSYTRVRWAG